MSASLKDLSARSSYYQARLTLIFILLAVILEGALAGYWLFFLEPKLEGEITAYSKSLSQAQAEILALDLSEQEGELRLDRLTLAMDKILLFRLPQSERPFTRQIRLEIDQDALAVADERLDFSRGEESPANSEEIAIPLYCPTTKELLGIAIFSNNQEILFDLMQNVRAKFTFGSSLIVLILIGVWFIVIRLGRRLSAYANDLARAQQTTQQIIASLQDMRIVMDSDGLILEVNPYTLHLLGYSEGDMAGRHISEFMTDHGFFKETHLEHFKSTFIMNNREKIFIAKDGSQRQVMISGAYLAPDQGKFSGIICMAKDISALKEAERKLEEKRVQMEHQGRLSALGEMATGMAHEINQPLYIIRLAADCLADFFTGQGEKGEAAQDVDKIQDQVKRATSIITNMRSFARASDGHLARHNVAEPINLALSFFREQFRQHAITFSEEIAPDLPRAQIDPQKIEQIVVNLLTNARHAVLARQEQEGDPAYVPKITTRLSGVDEALVFAVEDNGIGMAKETKERCLEPFYTTKEVGQGTGLGLSIIHGIISEMDMSLEIDSEPNQGSCFRVIIRPVATA
ncbi:MAG: ATP-binding protein [Thermodesulfobacteriota bacterium]